MKVELERETLVPYLSVLGSIAPKASANLSAVLSMVKIETTGTTDIVMTVTDLSQRLSVRAPATRITEPGATLMDAHKFAQIVRALPDGASISMTENREQDKVKVQSGKSRFLLAVADSDTFPEPKFQDAAVEASIAVKDVRNLLRGTAFMMPKDDARYYLNGALFEVSAGSMSVVATNGHYLGLCRADGATGSGEVQVILPRASVLELDRILEQAPEDENAHFWFTKDGVSMECAEYRYYSGTIDGKFPDYKRIIPIEKGFKGRVSVDTESLAAAISRAALVLSNAENPNKRGILLSFNEWGITLAADNGFGDTAQDYASASYTGEEIIIGANPAYLLSVLKASRTGNTTWTLYDPASAILVKESREIEGWFSTYVIMPLRT